MTTLGMIGAGAASAGMGLLGGIIGNQRYRKNVERNMALQLAGNKELAEYQKKLDLEMWKNTNYAAQRKELEKAGLNVGLMYGMSGGGSATTGGSGGGVSASGQGNQELSMDLINAMATKKQIELTDAQINKTNAEAENLRGIEREVKGAQVQDLLQGVENKKAQETLTKVETQLKGLQATYEGESMEDRLSDIKSTAGRTKALMGIAKLEENMANETYDSKVKLIERELINKTLETLNIEAKTNLTNQQIKESTERIINMVETRHLKGEDIDINQFKAELQAQYPSITNQAGYMADQALRTLQAIFGIREARRNVEKRDK